MHESPIIYGIVSAAIGGTCGGVGYLWAGIHGLNRGGSSGMMMSTVAGAVLGVAVLTSPLYEHFNSHATTDTNAASITLQDCLKSDQAKNARTVELLKQPDGSAACKFTP